MRATCDMHIHAVYFTNVWKNTATTVQMHSRGQGASYGRHAYAAASCRRRDLATAGKTEFVKSEPLLMRKKHRSFSSAEKPANRRTGRCPGNKDGNRAVKAAPNRRERTQAAENRAVQGRTHAHARSGRVLGCVGLACVCVCVFSSQLSVCVACSPCVRVRVCSAGGSGSPSHHETPNATTNMSLISSFLPQRHKARLNL